MKGVMLLIIVVLVMALIGWITFSASEDRATFSIESQKIKDDTHKLIDEGRDATHKAVEDAKKFVN